MHRSDNAAAAVLRASIGAAMLALVSLPAHAGDVEVARCGAPCAEVASVVNAAGVPGLVKKIRFEGARLAPSAASAVKDIARRWAKVPSGVLRLTVDAAGAQGDQRRTTAAARAAVLTRTLAGAGLSTTRFEVEAAPGAR